MFADAIPLSVSLRSYASESVAHTHSFQQLVLPVSGYLELQVAGRVRLVDPLGCALVPPGERHSFHGVGENSLLVLDMGPHSIEDELAQRFLDSASSRIFFPLPATLRPLLRAAAEHLQGDATSAARRRWAALVALTLAEQAERVSKRRPEKLSRALAYIEVRAAHPIQVADVAQAAGLKASQLHALFARWLDTTPQEVIAERRLDLAERLLLESELPIAEVALRCGFADQASLGRSLRRRRNITPASLRQAYRSPDAVPASSPPCV